MAQPAELAHCAQGLSVGTAMRLISARALGHACQRGQHAAPEAFVAQQPGSSNTGIVLPGAIN